MLNWLFNRYVYIIFNRVYDYAFEGAFSNEIKAKDHIKFLVETEHGHINDYIVEKCQVF
jgi:hypothetical protein